MYTTSTDDRPKPTVYDWWEVVDEMFCYNCCITEKKPLNKVLVADIECVLSFRQQRKNLDTQIHYSEIYNNHIIKFGTTQQNG
jgi:hypothetical protein